MPFCDCSTIEGKSELSTNYLHDTQCNTYPYTGAGHILLLYTLPQGKGLDKEVEPVPGQQ